MSDNTVPGGGENKSQATVDISVKVYPVKNQEQNKNNLLAFASVTLGGCFAVTNIRVMNSVKGPFVAMPSKKGTDGQFHDTCFPTTAAMREKLNEAVMNEFEKVTQKESVRGAIRNSPKETAVHPDTERPAQRTAGAR